MNRFVLLATALVLMCSSSIFAEDDSQEINQEINMVRAELSKMFPAATSADIISTSVDGVYRLAVQGSYAYALVQGDFVLIGDLYNTKTRENLGDVAQGEDLKRELVNHEDKMIVFGPKDAEHKITVFTDVTCFYCKKLHGEISELTSAGIQVRYLMWPRQGLKSEGFNKNLAVWCNANQQTAMTDAKAGRSVPDATCENPIAETFQFGRQAGISGTPLILFEDGSRQPGYLPSAQLIATIKAKSVGG